MLNKSHLEEIILIFFVSDEWMILRRNNTHIFCFSDTFFKYFLFLISKSHLEKIIPIFFVSDEWMILKKNNTNIFYFW